MFDVIHLSETWSDKKSKFDNFLSEYMCFDIVRTKINRAFRNSGGISVFIKRSTFRPMFRCRIHEEHSESIVFLQIILIFVNISPEGS